MSEADGLKLNTAAFDAAVVRLAMTSKKAAVDVMRDQARLLFVEVAKITPPYGGKASTGRKAELQGRTAVARDIYSLYGTRSDAYTAIAQTNVQAANAFWHHLGQKNDALANSILRDVTGKSLGKFDGGTLHKRTAGGSRRRSSRANAKTQSVREFAYFVSDAENLAAYVRQRQTHVWWLASGWSDALRALGARVPFGTDRHGASPGRLRVLVTDKSIIITMENQVTYGRAVKDIERRIQWALNKRVGKLDNKWNNYIGRAARESGFRKR